MRAGSCAKIVLIACTVILVMGSMAAVVLAGGPGGIEEGKSPDGAHVAPTPVPRFLTLPFPKGSGRLTQGWAYEGFRDGQLHGGVDWGLDQGAPILAAADGVAMACRQWQYGNFVCIKHDNGYFTLYAHLRCAASTLKSYPESQRANTDYHEWTPVRRGEVIGYCGKDGALGGDYPHLHFEVRTSSWGQHSDIAVDPYGIRSKASLYPPKTSVTPNSQYMWTTNPPSAPDMQNASGNSTAHKRENVSASSTQSGNDAGQKVPDASMDVDTWWSSEHETWEDWLYVDMEPEDDFGRVTLLWGSAYPQY